MRTYNQTSVEIEKEICRLYEEGESSVKLSKKFSTNPSTVLQIVRRNGGQTRTTKETSKRYTFNENYFSKIDSEDKAYWLGFILADGCICRNDLIIVLKESDASHLDKFIKCIGGDNVYQKVESDNSWGKHDAVRLSIRSKKMFNDLMALGITPNKSLTATVPMNIPKKLIRHFWRGVVDGDGTMCYYNNKKGKYQYRYLAVGLTGSKSVVESFIDYIKKASGILLRLNKDKNVWRTKTACFNAVEICSLLYNNSVIYLDRKKDLYSKYVKTHAHYS